MANKRGVNAQNNPGNFANNPARASEAARKGHAMGRSHQFTPAEAREAGRKAVKNHHETD